MCFFRVFFLVLLLFWGGNDFKAFNNVRDILYNTDAITSVVKLIVHRPMDIYIKKRKEIRRNPIPSIYIAYSYNFLFISSNITLL